jgi:hypothetical protein
MALHSVFLAGTLFDIFISCRSFKLTSCRSYSYLLFLGITERNLHNKCQQRYELLFHRALHNYRALARGTEVS